jgi:hypothetical protein
MRKNDLSHEWVNLVKQLDLRPGDAAIDLQTAADRLLPILNWEVTDGGRCRGRTVAMTFGKQTLEQVAQQIEEQQLASVKLVAAHPSSPPFADDKFHAVIMRTTDGVPNLPAAVAHAHRIGKAGARVAVRHTDWTVELPKATEQEQTLLAALKPSCCDDGRHLFDTFTHFNPRAWTDVRYDVFTAGHRDSRQKTRHPYDWRTMLKEQLARARAFSSREILDLIERLENTRGAKVVADRYVAVGVKA